MKKPLINVCDRSIQHFKNILLNSNKKYIMIGVESGGCNGLRYYINPTSTQNKYDELLYIKNIPILICSKSLIYIIGTNIQWKSSLMSEGIEFINPNAKNKCGCGETFST